MNESCSHYYPTEAKPNQNSFLSNSYAETGAGGINAELMYYSSLFKSNTSRDWSESKRLKRLSQQYAPSFDVMVSCLSNS